MAAVAVAAVAVSVAARHLPPLLRRLLLPLLLPRRPPLLPARGDHRLPSDLQRIDGGLLQCGWCGGGKMEAAAVVAVAQPVTCSAAAAAFATASVV